MIKQVLLDKLQNDKSQAEMKKMKYKTISKKIKYRITRFRR
jgi:hypothetical protein